MDPERLFGLLSSIQANFFLEEEIESELLLAGFWCCHRRGSRGVRLVLLLLLLMGKVKGDIDRPAGFLTFGGEMEAEAFVIRGFDEF